MSSVSSPQPATSAPDPADFSVVLGGPLFQLWRRMRLADDALELMRRRVLTIALFTWLPLLVLSALEGHLLGGSVSVPFLYDIEVHVRFLVTLPLLVGAELVVHQQMRPTVRQFLDRQLIPAQDMPRFQAAVKSAMRLRNSLAAEGMLVALVYVVGVFFIWRQYVALDAATWYATSAADGSRLSLAGMWYGYVSLPVFQFLLLRWYFRIFIWARFLWQVSRIKLNLITINPDRLGGLGMFSDVVVAFIPLAVAHGALLSGQLANRILFLGGSLPDFKVEIALIVVFVLCVVLGPLLLFSDQLFHAKLAGNREYGVLAQRYVREFEMKWLRGGAPAGEALVGSADVGSLNDLNGSMEVVRTMRSVPFGRDAVIQIAIATLAPIVPLVLTMMPLEELLRKLAGVLF